MTLTAFLHGYPPLWSMGGEMATHRALRAVPGSTVFTTVLEEYQLDGVSVMPATGVSVQCIKDDARSVGASVLFGHSRLSDETIRAARHLDLPSILTVHAPPQFGKDLRRARATATVRLYNTEVARKEWHDLEGWLLHPPIGEPLEMPEGPRNALTLTSSLVNKGAARVLKLAARRWDQRFIIVESPAHPTHGDPAFWEQAERLDNVEIWPRLHPDEMNRLWAETRVLLVPSRYETYGMAAVEAAHTYAMVGLLLLGVALGGVAIVIFDTVMGRTGAWVAGGCTWVALAAFWYAMPLVGRHDDDNRY